MLLHMILWAALTVEVSVAHLFSTHIIIISWMVLPLTVTGMGNHMLLHMILWVVPTAVVSCLWRLDTKCLSLSVDSACVPAKVIFHARGVATVVCPSPSLGCACPSSLYGLCM